MCYSIGMSQWSCVEARIKQLGLVPEEFEKELIKSYLDSRGGKDVFRPRDLKANNIMKSLGLWQIDECNKVKEHNLHKASSCRTLVGVLTRRGGEIAKELLDQKALSIDSKLAKDFPHRILSLFCGLLSNHENELSLNVISEYFKTTFGYDRFPFLYNSPVFPSELLFPIAEQYLDSFASCLVDLGVKEFHEHNTKGWYQTRGFRTCKEVVERLKLMTQVELKETEKALMQRNGSSFAKLAVLLKFEKNSQVQMTDLDSAETLVNNRENVRSFLESLHKEGYITPIPTHDLPCIQVRELDDVRNELYTTMKADNERFWLEEPTTEPRELQKGDKIVIVDVSNVAFDNVPKGQKPRLSQVLSAINYYKDKGFEPVSIADANLRHIIDETQEFQRKLDNGKIEQSPKGIRADEYILTLAKDKYPDAKIVTNDAFSDEKLKVRYGNIIRNPRRLQKFKVHKGEFVPLDSELRT